MANDKLTYEVDIDMGKFETAFDNMLKLSARLNEKLTTNDKEMSDIKKAVNETAENMKKLSENTEKFNNETENAGQKTSRLKDTLGHVATGMSMAFGEKVFDSIQEIGAKVVGFGKEAFTLAGDWNEAQNVVSTSFGKMGESVTKWVENNSEKFGMNKAQMEESIGTFGAMAKSMGISDEKSAQMNENLLKRAADLGSFYNKSNEETQTALKGIYTGEGEALKGMGVIMNDQTLQQEALKEGIKKKMSAMTQDEKVQLRYNLVMKQSKVAAGDFEKTAGNSLPNAMKKLTAQMQNTAMNIASKFLPVVQTALSGMSDAMHGNFKKLTVDLPKELNKLVSYLTSNLAKGLNNLFKLVTTHSDQIMSNASKMGAKLGSWLGDLLTKLINYILTHIPQIIGTLVTLGVSIMNFFTNLGANLLGSIFKDFGEIGMNLVKGLWHGITSGWDWLVKGLNGLMGGLVNGVKGILGIHSPSKVFSEIGSFMSQGMGEGFVEEHEKTAEKINKHIKKHTKRHRKHARKHSKHHSKHHRRHRRHGSHSLSAKEITINLKIYLDSRKIADKIIKQNMTRHARTHVHKH